MHHSSDTIFNYYNSGDTSMSIYKNNFLIDKNTHNRENHCTSSGLLNLFKYNSIKN